MHRIDAPGHVANKFVEPNSGTGAAGTDIGAEWLTDIQENVAGVVEGAGLTLVKGTDVEPAGYAQLRDAVRIESGRSASTAFKNLFINGGFDLWQRADVLPPSWLLHAADGSYYTADRWVVNASAGGEVTVSRVDLGVAGGRAGKSGRWAMQLAMSVAGSGPTLEQRVEGVEQFDGQKLTVSFYLRTTAGSVNLTPYIRQDFGVGGSSAVTVEAAPIAVSTTWTRFSATFDVPSIAGKTLVGLGYLAIGLKGPASTFTFQVTAAQAEFGPIATEFAYVDLGTELERASRYFWKTYDPDVALFTITTVGAIETDETGGKLEGLNIVFPVTMRTTPAVYFVSPRTGIPFRVERPIGSDATVGAVTETGQRCCGAPDTTGVATGVARAHVIADAEI